MPLFYVLEDAETHLKTSKAGNQEVKKLEQMLQDMKKTLTDSQKIIKDITADRDK